MQVTQETRPGSRVGLTIVVEADQVKKNYEKAFRQLSQNVQVHGFRKGKAPRHLVMRYIGKERLQATALDDVINTSVAQAIKDASLRTLGNFELETDVNQLLAQFDPNADLTFSGWVEVFPEAKLGDYHHLAVTVTRVDPNPDRVEQTLLTWRKERAILLPVEDRGAEMGDLVRIDFQGFDEDEIPVDGTKGKDVEIEMGPDSLIPGFIEQLVGMTLDETRMIQATFPEDYSMAELAGQSLTFEVTLHEIKTRELPELSDEFIQEFTDCTTVAEVRERLEENIRRESRTQCLNQLQDALIQAVVDCTEVELPEKLITQEMNQLLAQRLSYIQEQHGLSPNDLNQMIRKMPPADLQKIQGQVRPDAIQRVQRSLALSALIKQEGIEVGSTELEFEVRRTLSQFSPEERQKLDLKELADAIRERTLVDKLINWLRSQATITWVDADGNPVDPPNLDPPQLQPEPSGELESAIPDAEFTESETDSETDSETGAEAISESASESETGIAESESESSTEPDAGLEVMSEAEAASETVATQSDSEPGATLDPKAQVAESMESEQGSEPEIASDPIGSEVSSVPLDQSSEPSEPQPDPESSADNANP